MFVRILVATSGVATAVVAGISLVIVILRRTNQIGANPLLGFVVTYAFLSCIFLIGLSLFFIGRSNRFWDKR